MINLVIMANFVKPIFNDRHVVLDNFLEGIISIPARRALEKEKIDSLEKLVDYSDKEILQLHGFGKNTIEKTEKLHERKSCLFQNSKLILNDKQRYISMSLVRRRRQRISGVLLQSF